MSPRMELRAGSADKWCDGPKEKCRQRSQEILLCS